MLKMKCLLTLSYTFQCLKQIHAISCVQIEMFNAHMFSQQRISSMAVENLPVFNSVSKDKLMNIATQVYSSCYLFSDTLDSFFVNSFWKRYQIGPTTRKTTEQDKSPAANIWDHFDMGNQPYQVFYVGYIWYQHLSRIN